MTQWGCGRGHTFMGSYEDMMRSVSQGCLQCRQEDRQRVEPIKQAIREMLPEIVAAFRAGAAEKGEGQT